MDKKKPANTEELLQHLSLCFPIRDMSQSENGNVLDIAHPILLGEFYPLLQAFNEAGPLQIDAVETPCGAQPQVDVFRGRFPLDTMRRIHQAMPERLAARILIRGPFGVGLVPLATSDLYYMLREMAIASGAKDGRKIIFKLFEAQNNPKEKLASLRIIKLLREEGYDIEVEDATCYTADQAFSPTHYQDAIEACIANDSEAFLDLPPIVSTISIKDMIGGLCGTSKDQAPPDYADASALTEKMSVIAPKGQDTPYILAVHSHHTGLSVPAYAVSILEAAVQKRRLRIDVLLSGTSFATLRELSATLEDMGYPGFLSTEQWKVLEQLEQVLERVRAMYRETYVDTTMISAEARRRVKIPGGAVPSMIRLFVTPLATYTGKTEEEACDILLEYMEQAWRELGKPHSVTPGAKYLGQTAFHMAKIAASRDDMTSTQASSESDTTWLYEGLPMELVEYWRGEMPLQPKQAVFESICRQSLEHHLPRLLRDGQNAELREAILAHPADKEHAAGLLEAFAPPAKARELFAQESIQSLLTQLEEKNFYLELVEIAETLPGAAERDASRYEEIYFQRKALLAQLEYQFATQRMDFLEMKSRYDRYYQLLDHVGTRKTPIAQASTPRVKAIFQEIQSLISHRTTLSRLEDGVFAALLMAPNPQNPVDFVVQKMLFTPRAAFPQEWTGPHHGDPGFVSNIMGQPRSYKSVMQEAELFWRKLAHQRYLVPTSPSGINFLAKEVQKIKDPSVAQLVMHQYQSDPRILS